MAKVFLMAIGEPFSLGVEVLYSALMSDKHQAKVCFFRDWSLGKTYTRVPEEHERGYYVDGILKIPDADLPPVSEEEDAAFLSILQSFSPQIVGLSCRSMEAKRLVPMIIASARRALPDALIVCGGWEPSMDPEFFLNAGADLILRGEGERALLSLCERIDSGQSWRDTPNAVYCADDSLQYTSMLPLIEDLDTLPVTTTPVEDTILLSIESSYDEIIKQRPYSILTGRGCTGSCSFCITSAWREMYKKDGLQAKRIRTRSIESLLPELHAAKNAGHNLIVFSDDYFIRPIAKMIDFFNTYNKEIQIPYTAAIDYHLLLENDLLFNEVTKFLVQAYCGLQSGDEHFNRNIHNRKTSHETYIALIRKYLAAFVHTRIHFIGGHPLQTEEVFETTLDFIRTVAQLRTQPLPKLDLVNTYFYPLPQAPVVIKHSLPLHNSYDRKKWLYEAILMDVRLVTTDAAFQAIRENAEYREDPFLLQAQLPILKQAWESACLRRIVSDLAGKEVLFMGNGRAYKASKHLFSSSRPVAMLLDEPYASRVPGGHCDGLPVITPDEAVAKGMRLPLVLFTGEWYLPRRIYRKYPGLAANMTLVHHRFSQFLL